jgi:hypothetical protein
MAEYGFAAVLKQISAALMEAVAVTDLLGELFTLSGEDEMLFARLKNMHVVVHEYPGINITFPPLTFCPRRTR